MARSNYIYLVTIGGKPHAAFTVKYEMENTLPSDGDGVEVFRIKDNGDDQPIIKITEDYYE